MITTRPATLRLLASLWKIAVVVFAVVGCVRSASAASVELGQRWTNYFGDADQRLALLVNSEEKLKGRIVWKYEANRRTIQRGEADVKVGPDEAAIVEIRLRLPPVRDGVIFRTDLTVELLVDDKTVADVEHAIWLFPEDAFADRRQWLKDLGLALYDPVGDTEARFDKEEIPYVWLRNLAAVEQLDEGLLIIGEGVSLEEVPELGKLLAAKAATGVDVLCLPFADGSIPLPGAVGRPARAVNWRRREIIGQLDKRLDWRAWPPDNKISIRGFRPIAAYNELRLQVSEERDAWPWLQADFGEEQGNDKNGILVLCGFSVVQPWSAGPTPRFLLARMLEWIDDQPTSPEPIPKKE